MVCHGMVVAIPAKEVILGGTDENDLHVLEDLQPTWRPVPPPDVAVQWRQLAEKAFPHTLHVVFPTGASFQENTHQTLSCLRSALHVCSAKPLRFHVDPKKVVGMGAIALQPELRA